MILVLFFLVMVLLISFIIIILLLSNIQINLENIYISNLCKRIRVEFNVHLKVYFLNKVKIASIRIKKEKIKKIYNKNLKKLKSKYSTKKKKMITKILLKSNYILNKVNIQGNIGTENSHLTAITVGVINAIIPFVTFKKNAQISKKKYYCNIIPVYANKNLININANIDINFKVKEIVSNIIKIRKIMN